MDWHIADYEPSTIDREGGSIGEGAHTHRLKTEEWLGDWIWRAGQIDVEMSYLAETWISAPGSKANLKEHFVPRIRVAQPAAISRPFHMGSADSELLAQRERHPAWRLQQALGISAPPEHFINLRQVHFLTTNLAPRKFF